MVYGLERELYLGSTFAVLNERPEGRDVSRGPVSRAVANVNIRMSVCLGLARDLSEPRPLPLQRSETAIEQRTYKEWFDRALQPSIGQTIYFLSRTIKRNTAGR
jgi:hypothetical protein